MENLILWVSTILLAVFLAAVGISKRRRNGPKLPPGPTRIPVLGNWLQLGNNLDHRLFAGLSDKHGHIFHLQMGLRSQVVVSSPELANAVLQTQGVEFGSRPLSPASDVFSGGGRDVLFASYGDSWRKMRRVMTVSLFTDKAVREHRCVWEDEASRLVDELKSASVVSDLRMRLQLLMHNNVYRMLFARRFEGVDDPAFMELYGVNSKRSVLAQSSAYSYGDYLPVLRPFIRGYLKICRDVYQKRHNLFHHYVRERIKKKKEQKGLERAGIDHMVEAKENGEINDTDVLHLIENLNIAGIGTVVRAIEWGVVELTNNPRVLTKLQTELDTVLGRCVPIAEPDTKRLPYLQAVVKEILRLRTLAPLLAPHMNLNDAKLGGYDVPAQSRVTVNAWWLANNPKHWKRPEEFRPERFLEEESHVEITGNDLRYIPFGVGRRSCPGVAVALPIVGVTLGRLAQSFEFSVAAGETKIDTTEKNSQLSLRISKPFTTVFNPRI